MAACTSSAGRELYLSDGYWVWCVVWIVMQSKKEIYQANATQCEARAQEMPPGLRREFLALAAHWRKLASGATDAADRRMQEATDRD